MASLKDIKRHIIAVKQTQKLTKAMNMVAAAKLRAIQGRTERFRYYAEEHARLVEEIGRRSGDTSSNFVHSKSQQEKALILLFTSDKGLCGSFNSNIFQKLDAHILKLRDEGKEPELFVFGRKGNDYYRRRRIHFFDLLTQDDYLPEDYANFNYELAQKATNALIKSFEENIFKEVWLCHTQFVNLSRHVVAIEKFLPLSSEKSKEHSLVNTDSIDYAIEPKAEELLNRLIPRSLAIMVYQAYLESTTSENAARMQAMDNASKSCKDIIENLTMSYNKARQAAVTNELLDIVNGAEALKG
jgi:F-type H+-transporting ATPase subunit gamma